MGSILLGGKNQLPDRRLVLLCGCYFRLLKSVGYFAFRKAVAECVSFTIAVASCYAVWFRRIFVSRSEESKGATVYRCKWGCSHRCIGGVRRIIFKLNIEIGSCGMEDACGKVKTKPPGKAA